MFDESMFTKLAWRLVSNPTSLLSQVLMTKYAKSGQWPHAQPSSPISASKGSDAWKGASCGFQNLSHQINWKLGNGRHMKLGIDAWVPNIPGGVPQLKSLFAFLATEPVCSLKQTGLHLRSWNTRKLFTIFILSHAWQMCAIPISSYGSPDLCLWKGSPSGILSVKGIFIHNCFLQGHGKLGNTFWDCVEISFTTTPQVGSKENVFEYFPYNICLTKTSYSSPS